MLKKIKNFVYPLPDGPVPHSNPAEYAKACGKFRLAGGLDSVLKPVLTTFRAIFVRRKIRLWHYSLLGLAQYQPLQEWACSKFRLTDRLISVAKRIRAMFQTNFVLMKIRILQIVPVMAYNGSHGNPLSM
jgi:hypothetical protein